MKQREKTDQELENFIHRLVMREIATYDECFANLSADQCVGMRQSYVKLNSPKK